MTITTTTSAQQQWLYALTSVVEDVQGTSTVQEVAAIIVRGGLALGFVRARLMLLSEDGRTLHGIAEHGNCGLADFQSFCLALSESIYTQRVLASREPVYFVGQECGPWALGQRFASQQFMPPIGEWAHIPLWAGDRCWGVLSLDNADQPCKLNGEQRAILALFSRQVAAALEQVRLVREEQRRREERDGLEVLIEVAGDVQRAQTLQEIADILVEGGLRLGFDRARLWLLSEDERRLIGASQRGNQGLHNFIGFTVPALASTYMQRVLAERDPIFFHDEEFGQSFLHRHHAASGYRPPVGEWVGIPLHADDRCCGVLMLDNSNRPAWLHPELRRLLTLFGRYAAAALERARKSYERDWLLRLTELASETQQAQTLRDVGKLIVLGGLELGFTRARLWRYDHARAELVGLSEAGNAGLPPFESIRIPLAEASFAGYGDQTQQLQVFQGLEEGDSYLLRRFGAAGFQPPVGEWVNIPLWANGQILGVLTLDNTTHPRVLYPGQRDILKLLCRQAATALERARLYEEEQRQRSEKDWLRLLAEVTEQAQQARDLRGVGDAIVRGAQRLEFQRVRLWLLSEDGLALIGFVEAGNYGLAGFNAFRMLISGSQYVSGILRQHEPLILHGRDSIPARLDEHFAAQGFIPPKEWLCVPLWGSEGCLGMLALDNGDQEHIRPEQRTLVGLFGRQAAAALERARRVYERDWLRTLTSVAAEAQQVLGLRAAVERLLGGCRSLGFERARLWCLSDDGQTLTGFSQVGNRGLEQFTGYKVAIADSHYMQESLATRLPRVFSGRETRPSVLDQQFAAAGFEPPIGEWVETSLWVGDRPWGILTLDNARSPRVLSDEQRVLLPLLSSQVTAAIERASRYEEEQRKAHDLYVLNQAERALPRLADLDDDRLWHALLTTICAPFALGLEHTTLLLVEAGGTRLREHMSLNRAGYERNAGDSFAESHAALSFDEYIAYLSDSSSRLPLNRIEQPDWSIACDPGDALTALLQGHSARLFSAAEAARVLPEPFAARFSSHGCLLVPISTGERPIGLIVVEDMRQSTRQHRLTDHHLPEHLQELLRSAALVRENVQQRHAREQMTQLTHMVIADLGDRNLKEVLALICRTARAVTGADSVVLYPFLPGDSHEFYDIALVQSDGLLQWPQLHKKSRPDAIAQRVLRSRRLSHAQLGGRALAEHPFIQREGIRAFAAVEVSVPGGEPIGVLFVNFKSPRTFSEFEWTQAHTLATLAALAISNARARQEVIEQSRAIGERELAILHDVLKQALSTSTKPGAQRALIQRLLVAARKLLDRNDISVGVILLRTWHQADPRQVPQEGRRKFYWDANGRLCENDDTEVDIAEGITGRALLSGQSQRVDDVWSPSWRDIFVPGQAPETQSELDVPIRSRGNGRSIGVFNIESPAACAFGQEHQEMIERLAAVASLALLNLQRQIDLDAALNTAQAVGTELHLGDVLRKAFEQLRRLFPDARLFMLTYDASDRALEFRPESRDFYPIDAQTFSRMRRVALDGMSIASEVARRSLASGKVEVINTPDVRRKPSYLKLIPSTRSKLCITLMHADQLLGVLGLESDRYEAFSHDDVTLVRLVSQQISLAIDRASQSAQLYFTTSVAVRTLWAAELAHDINSEVGHMRLVIDRLKHTPGMSDRSLQQLNAVDQRAARMAHILDSVRHENQLSGEVLPLNEWIAQVLGSVELGSVRVVYDLAASDICVRAQPMVLQRMLLHLVRNAREAMKGRADGQLTVRTRAEAHQAEIQLENNGASIPEEVRSKLMQEPFTTKQQPGGLGLVFVRMMAGEMGGTVRLLPEEPAGGGAIFALTLPLAQGATKGD